MTTDGPYISKTFGSASPRGRREVVSTVDRGIPTDIGEDNRHSGLRRLKSRSWGSIRRWEKENELLFAMIEDESEWLAELFPDEIIAPEFFFFALEDGVLLCKLANLIQEYAEQYGKENNIEIPECHLKYHPRSKTRGQLGQFRARENVTAFLGWCRKHQVPEVILFESNDVVQTEDLREGAREVVICLMEIARRSFKYGVKPPKLIILEKEIDEEERTEGLGSPYSVDSGVDTEISLEGKDDSTLINSETHISFSSSENVEINNALNSINGWENEQKVKVSATENERADGVDGSKAKKSNDANQSSNKPQSELDRKVLSLIEEYSVGKIFRLKEGKYIILGRVMFVRMLNEHVLVRIGGGWDGLEHYLMTHVKHGSQSQNPPSTPAANLIRSTTPISRPDTRRTIKPISPAASTNSLAEGKKDEYLPFTPPLQAGLISRGRESPLRKTSRVKDTDEADITRAIRRIENTVSENIQKKTNSNSALDLAASVNNCKNCSSNRKLVPSKMATSEFADFSSNVNENGEYYRLVKDAAESQRSDSQVMDKKLEVGETPILNGDLDTEQKHPVDDGEASGTVNDCMHVVITKKESEEEKAGEKKSQGPRKVQADAKEIKSPSKSAAASAARPTGNSKTSSKVDRKAPTSKKTTTKSATTTTAKPPPKSVKEKKSGGAAKTLPAKPIFKVSTATGSTVLESKSISTKAGVSKSATAGSKSAGMKSEVTKPATSGAKQSPGKAAPKTSAAATAKTASVKTDPKSKKEEGKKVANGKKSPSDDATDGAVVSTKAKVNGVSKVTAQNKSKTDAQTPKASASAKSATSARTKPPKANGKATSVVDKTKEKTSVTDKAPAKTVNKADQSKPASTVKPLATDSRSKKPTTPSTAKAPSAAAKVNEASRKPAATSKPSSAPSKGPTAAKSSKQPSKPASAPSSTTATKSTTAASKSAKPTAKVAPSTIGDKKPTATKAKSTHAGYKDKVATSSSKAPAAKSGKESKTSKPASAKSTKVEKKDNKKAPKAIADKNKKDIGEKHVSKETVVVEQKDKINIDSALVAPVDNVEIYNKGTSEPIKASTEAVVVQSTERAQNDETEATEVITADYAQLQSEGEPSKLGSQIGDSEMEQRDESPLLIAGGNDFSNGLLAQGNDEIQPSSEQFVTQPEVKIKSVEEELSCKEVEEAAEEEVVDEVLSSPTSTEDKADIEGSISNPSKLNIKDAYSIGEDESLQFMEDDKQKVTCEEDEELVAKGESEERDAESTMFDESKLISLEEITARCDEDDIREGAVAPTPPETPVPDNASAEASAALEIGDELRFETASGVLSTAEEIASETDTMKSEIEGSNYEVEDTEVYQPDEAPSAAPEQDILPEANSTDELLSKDNASDGEDTYADNSFETKSADVEYPGEDSSQIDSISADASDRAEDKDIEYEHEVLEHDLPEGNDSTVESHSPHVDNTVGDFREAFETQGIGREAEHVSMDTEISDEAEVEKELESSSDVEVVVDPELPGEATTPENVEITDDSEGRQTSEFSQEIVSSQSFGFSSDPDTYQERVGDDVSPNERNEPYFIGSKGTEELMQREPIEQEKISDGFHGDDEPLQADVSDNRESEARVEQEEVSDLEEEQEFENGENVESYGVSVNEVSISVTESYNQEAAISPVDSEPHLPESTVDDSVLVNAEESEKCDMETVAIEQGHNDNYILGEDVLVTADAGQNEILNPDIGLQENGNEEEKAQDSEECKEAAHDEEEMEDANEETLKHLDLGHQEADSSLMEDQFTPISDLTDDLRSPLAKDSFSNFVSESQEEREYEDKSDAEEEEFNSEAIELAKESVRVARSLDDSCEEGTPPSTSQALEDGIVQRLDGDFETEDQGLPAQYESSSFPSTAAPQVISSPCMSSDGEDFEEEEERRREEELDQSDKPGDVLVDVVPDLKTKNDAEDVSQNSSVAMDPATADLITADPVITTDGAGFPDAATAETLSNIYRAEADSHDVQFGYERQLSEDQDMKVSGTEEETSLNEDGLKSEKFIMEPGVATGSDSFNGGNDASHGCQGAESFSVTGGTEKFPIGDGIEEIPDNAMELQKGFQDASHDELGKDAQFENDEEEVSKELDRASFDVIQNEGHDQDFENSLQSGVRAQGEEVDSVIAGTQFQGFEGTSYEEVEKKCDESIETHKEKSDGIFIASKTEEDEIAQERAFEDHVTSSLERSDAERNMQSDDQTTDSSDFVLLDSPVKQVRAGNSDEVIAESDTDAQDILQDSLKESDSGDSPFHHIELKTEETKEEERLDEETPNEEAPDEEAPHEEAPHEEAPDEEAPEEQADHHLQKEDFSGKDDTQDAYFLEDKFGTSGLEDQMLSVSSTVEELSNDSFDMQMNSSQSPNLFWQADMREEGKEFRSDPLEDDDESRMKFNKLMSENLNTGGPRYVYDGSDDEDGGEDYDDDDETY